MECALCLSVCQVVSSMKARGLPIPEVCQPPPDGASSASQQPVAAAASSQSMIWLHWSGAVTVYWPAMTTLTQLSSFRCLSAIQCHQSSTRVIDYSHQAYSYCPRVRHGNELVRPSVSVCLSCSGSCLLKAWMYKIHLWYRCTSWKYLGQDYWVKVPGTNRSDKCN